MYPEGLRVKRKKYLKEENHEQQRTPENGFSSLIQIKTTFYEWVIIARRLVGLKFSGLANK